MPLFNSVFLIDDDPTQTVILKAYFSQLGVPAIATATDPQIALETIRNHLNSIDLIVSDLQMPNVDGFELLRHLKDLGYRGKIALFSGVKNDLLEHASRLAVMHNLDLMGQLKKPLSKKSLDSVFLQESKEVTKPRNTDTAPITKGEFEDALRNGDIVPHYQPQVDVQTGRIVGAETLARWTTTDGRMVPPIVFLEIAEKIQRTEDLTFSLYRKVLQDVKSFLKVDPQQKFAINLSPFLVNDITLPDRLFSLMDSEGLMARNLSFEVTENSILDLDTTTLEVLSRLRINGFRVAIDDFGTGSSNIQTLRDFPYTELKIDKAFVHKAYANDFSAQTLSAAAALARQLKMETVAEGVEDINDWNFVREVGINVVQGYFIAKPMAPLGYLDFITKHDRGIDVSQFRSAA